MNDGVSRELEDVYFDIYAQEFYIYCSSMFRRESGLFQESNEGSTYVTAD